MSRTRFSVYVNALQGAYDTGAINKAVAYSSEISRYFNIKTYNQNGYEDAIALTSDVVMAEANYTQYLHKEVEQQKVVRYDNKFLDTSLLTTVNFGKVIYDYQVSSQTQQKIRNEDKKFPAILIQYTQSRVQTTRKYIIVSLDMVLGLVGGLASIILSILSWSLGEHEEFRL